MSPLRAVLVATVVGGQTGHRGIFQRDGVVNYRPGIAAKTSHHLAWISSVIKNPKYTNGPSPKSQMNVLIKPYRKVVREQDDYEPDLDSYPDTSSQQYAWPNPDEYGIEYAPNVC